MFCKNCGAEIDDSCLFCIKCGTKVGNVEEVQKSPSETYPAGNVLNQTVHPDEATDNVSIKNIIDKFPKDKVETLTKELLYGNQNKRFFVSGILFIISLLMLFTNTVQIGMWGMATTQNLFTFIESKVVVVMFVILYLASVAMMAKPLLLKTNITLLNVVPMAISLSATLLLTIIVFIIGVGQANDYGAQFSFTLTGWIMLISAIIAAVIAIRLTVEMKNNRN